MNVRLYIYSAYIRSVSLARAYVCVCTCKRAHRSVGDKEPRLHGNLGLALRQMERERETIYAGKSTMRRAREETRGLVRRQNKTSLRERKEEKERVRDAGGEKIKKSQETGE